MREYEVCIEDITPCGGEAHARKSLIEIETDDPEAYVKENGRYPITEQYVNFSGDLVIVTGNYGGYMLRYTFFE